jgi:hypothetical protein
MLGKSRVLFLVPAAALAHQVAERLRSEGVPSSRIDRFRFRELLDTSNGDEIWPRGAVTILSRDFANQTDVQERLTQTHWDLVIADELHLLGPARAATLRNLISAAGKVLLGTATPVEGELEGIVTPEVPDVVTWHRDMIVDEHGRSLVFAPRPKLRVVSFSTSITEDQVRETVNALCTTLERAGERRKLVARTLRCHLESSPAALERVLRRIVDGQTRFDAEVEEATPEEAEGVDEIGYWRTDLTTSEEIRLLVDRALQQIESNHTDATVRLIYRLYTEGDGTSGPLGVKETTSWLNRHGYRTRLGAHFGVGPLHRVLKNACYASGRWRYGIRNSRTGTLHDPSSIVEIAVPTILPLELFEQADSARTARR